MVPDLQQKDLRLVLDNAYGDHVSLPGRPSSIALHGVQKDGGGREGNHALLKVIERLFWSGSGDMDVDRLLT